MTWPDHPFNKDETVKCTKNEKAPVNLRRRMRRNFEVFASVSIGATTVPDRSLMSTANDVSPEDLGRCTWLFLHTLAAQYPESPTARQEKDAKDLIGILTRLYPCADCARHFADIVSRHPPDVSNGLAFEKWLCTTHNEVNLRLDKEQFDCTLIHTRWRGLECSETNNACSAGGENGSGMNKTRRRRRLGA